MITAEARELIRRLRAGEFDPGEAEAIAKLSAGDFVSEMKAIYPILFQEHRVGRKQEVGMARSLKFELDVRRSPGGLFPFVGMDLVLRKCLLVNSYDDSISGITAVTSLRVRHRGGRANDAALRMGKGSTLDRFPDGWAVKPVKGRWIRLSEDFLLKRGWRFEALRP